MRAQYSYPVPRTGTAAVQAAGQFSAILAELFADVPYVKKLGCDALGSSVIARAVFDDSGGADYSERLDGVVRRLLAFKDRVIGGIMPEMNLRMQAAPSRRRGWQGGVEKMAAARDGQAAAHGSAAEKKAAEMQPGGGRGAARPAGRGICRLGGGRAVLHGHVWSAAGLSGRDWAFRQDGGCGGRG